jgi:hypothetical protein
MTIDINAPLHFNKIVETFLVLFVLPNETASNGRRKHVKIIFKIKHYL